MLPATQHYDGLTLNRDGNDGKWSSFTLQVGTPCRQTIPTSQRDGMLTSLTKAQSVRLLPGASATAGDSIWVIIPEGCSLANPGLENCTASRGGVLDRNASTSWSTSQLANGGLYELDTFVESELGLDGNAYYGFDTISLGSSGTDIPTLDRQLVAGIATNDCMQAKDTA